MNKTRQYIVLDDIDIPREKLEIYEMIVHAFDVVWSNPVWVKEVKDKDNDKFLLGMFTVFTHGKHINATLLSTSEWVINVTIPIDVLIRRLLHYAIGHTHTDMV